MTKEYITIKELCSTYKISRQTVMRLLDDLPGSSVKEDIGRGLSEYKVSKDVITYFDELYAKDTNNTMTVTEITNIMGIDNPRFYTFSHKYGYYDKFIKTGKKVKRYHKLFIPKDVADEMIALFELHKAEKADMLKNASHSKYVPVTNYIDECYITDDFIAMMQDKLDCKQVDKVWFINKKENVDLFIEDYMRSVGYVSMLEAQVLLNVTRQRTYQLAIKHKSDESICIRPCMKRRQMFLSLSFIENRYDDDDIDELTDDMVSLSKLALTNRMSFNLMFKYLDNGSLRKYKGVHYYSINDFNNLPNELKESWKKKQCSKKTINNTIPIKTSGSISLSNAAKILRMNNSAFKAYLAKNGLLDSEYITTRNGSPDCKHLKIDLVLVNRILKGVDK